MYIIVIIFLITLFFQSFFGLVATLGKGDGRTWKICGSFSPHIPWVDTHTHTGLQRTAAAAMLVTAASFTVQA